MATKQVNKGGRPKAEDIEKLEETHANAYDMYQLTRSYRQVARQIGVSVATARDYVQKHDAWLAVSTGNDSELRRFNHATLDNCIARLMRQAASTSDADVLVKTTSTIEKLIRTQNTLLGLNKPVSVQVEHNINVVPWALSDEGRQAVYDLGVQGTSLVLDA